MIEVDDRNVHPVVNIDSMTGRLRRLVEKNTFECAAVDACNDQSWFYNINLPFNEILMLCCIGGQFARVCFV